MISRPPSPPSAEILFKGSLAAIGEAGDWLAAWLAPRAVPADAAFALRLCLEEALANIVMHGGEGEASIAASLAEEDGSLVLRISDDGMAFDPVTAESPKEAVIGGNGLILLRRYSNAMSYRREDGRNHLALRFTPADGMPAPDR